MIGATIAEMGMRVGLAPDTHSGPATARIMQIVQIVGMASSRVESATPGERRRRRIASAPPHHRVRETPAMIQVRGTWVKRVV
jgi:hypothetical protein